MTDETTHDRVDADAPAELVQPLVTAERHPIVLNVTWVVPAPTQQIPTHDITAVTTTLPKGDETALLIPAQPRDETIMLPRLPAVDDTVILAAVADKPQFTPARQVPAAWVGSLGRAPEILALSAFGVALVALGYVGGRTHASWAGIPYWIGQLVVFCPVVARLLSRRLTGTVESLTLVVGLAVNQYLTKVCYSPDQLRFPDELQHWAATRTLMYTGKLFTPNWALPVAVHFPGIEEIGAAFSSMTGLPVMTAALIVAGIAHLAFVLLLFAVVKRVTGSPTIAGLTCVIYATALHYLFFDSMYIYQTAALPFLMLAVWAAAAWQQEPGRNRVYPALALLGVAGVTVCHHVTAMVTVCVLAVMALCDLVFERPRRLKLLPLAGVALLILVLWLTFVATDIVSYLGPPLADMTSAVSQMIHGGPSSSDGSSSPGSSTWELAVQALGLLVLLVIFLRAIRPTLRARTHRAWRWAVLLGSAGFFATTGVRFLGSQGPELAGRASTFAYIPISILAALALASWDRYSPGPSLLSRAVPTGQGSRLAVGVSLSALLMVGARLGGWPPKYERLPGGYAVGAFEESVNPISVSAATWTGDWLGTDYRFAADTDGLTLLSTYGREDPVNTASRLYYDKEWGLADQNLQDSQSIDFVWVDLRLSHELPISGQYFPVDPQSGKHTTPIPVANLQKFDGIIGVSRVYDNGTIIMYDLRTAK